MKFSRYLLIAGIGGLMFCSFLSAQPQAASASSAVVPPLVSFSAKATDVQGRIITGIAGATFAIYKDEHEGSALWMETQNIQADAKGNYTVQLGATKPEGIPLEVFTSGEARWLGVSINGGAEQPRVLLLSVPYALKAADAETIGGLPPSAFVLAVPPAATGRATQDSVALAASSQSATSQVSSDVTTSGGTVNALPLFTTATNVQNSILTQTGRTAVNVAGKLNLPATGKATATAGKNSQPEAYVASAFDKTTSTAIPQTFQLQAEPASNDTATASGTLNLLYASGTNAPAETGLKIGSKGVITFASGQTFPGTVTGVTAGTDLTGGGTGGNVTLNLDTLALDLTYAQLGADNFFTGNQTVTGTLTAATGISQSATAAITAVGSRSSLSLYPSLAAGDFNGMVQAGDTAIVYSSGILGIGALDIVPWANATSGIRMNSAGQVFMGYPDDGLDFASVLYIQGNPDAMPLVANAGSGDFCYVNLVGDLTCTGTKNAVVPVDDGKRWVAMSAMESPVNWFEDAGSAQLVSGVAVVELDPTFIQTVNTTMDYKVFPVPNGDCKGLYVTNKTATSFEVHELGGGTSSVDFDFRIMAVRKNYEAVRFADRTNDVEKIRAGHEPMKPTGTKSPSLGRERATQTPPARAALQPNLAPTTSR